MAFYAPPDPVAGYCGIDWTTDPGNSGARRLYGRLGVPRQDKCSMGLQAPIFRAWLPTTESYQGGSLTMVRVFIAVVAGLLALAGSAYGQAFPTKQITLVVPFSAGGPTDTLARIMAERMSRTLGQTVVVDNTTGAAGTVGVGRVARAAPDGYTIGIGHWSTHVVNGAVYKLPYDLLADFEPVALVASRSSPCATACRSNPCRNSRPT
mgnify:CR=1 FL=1